MAECRFADSRWTAPCGWRGAASILFAMLFATWVARIGPAQTNHEELVGFTLPLDRNFGFSILLVDVDRDTDPDLVLGGTNGHKLYLNRGSGLFDDESGRIPLNGHVASDICAADLDGDGDVDLVFAEDWIGYTLLINDGTGRFTDETAARLPPVVGRTWHSGCAAADVDGDGDLDLAIGSYLQNNMLLLNDGRGRFSPGAPLVAGGSNGSILFADVDGDGDSDLLTSGLVFNRLELNDGQGRFTLSGNAIPAPRTPGELAAADLDGDGDVDLVLGSTPMAIYLNDGFGLFTDASSRLPVMPGYVIGVLDLCDMDGDGDVDIVASTGPPPSTVGRFILLENDGTGRFTDRTVYGGTPNQVFELTTGDVDLDGDVDVITYGRPSAAGHNPRLFVDVTRQLHVTAPPVRGQRFELSLRSTYGDVGLVDLGFARRDMPRPPLGTLRLDPATIVAFPAALLTGQPDVRFALGVPSDPSLAGLLFFAQGIVVDTAWPARSRLTGFVDLRVQ